MRPLDTSHQRFPDMAVAHEAPFTLEGDWVFVDLSRNHSRRWCDMQSCGNQVKARRHYARTKQAPSPTAPHAET